MSNTTENLNKTKEEIKQGQMTTQSVIDASGESKLLTKQLCEHFSDATGETIVDVMINGRPISQIMLFAKKKPFKKALTKEQIETIKEVTK